MARLGLAERPLCDLYHQDLEMSGNLILVFCEKTEKDVYKRQGYSCRVWRDLSNGATQEQLDEYLKTSLKFLKEKFEA